MHAHTHKKTNGVKILQLVEDSHEHNLAQCPSKSLEDVACLKFQAQLPTCLFPMVECVYVCLSIYVYVYDLFACILSLSALLQGDFSSRIQYSSVHRRWYRGYLGREEKKKKLTGRHYVIKHTQSLPQFTKWILVRRSSKRIGVCSSRTAWLGAYAVEGTSFPLKKIKKGKLSADRTWGK